MFDRMRVIDERPRISSAVEAEKLIETVMETLGALSHVVGEETGLVKAGRLKDAMEREARKAELAGTYMKGVEQIKLNAVALARFAKASRDHLPARGVRRRRGSAGSPSPPPSEPRSPTPQGTAARRWPPRFRPARTGRRAGSAPPTAAPARPRARCW